ncbi:angiopoietin-related protein 7-like [Amphibalanus amphitrite]|uniref:angiopoietin-related protein 7-like n=1 Tax=Amphibalanus amphitrite TaxID=1232801 RepID=UPI001C928B6A|nr:angiopoietin-related protein 7-like [Amphibalanus amphitrite]
MARGWRGILVSTLLVVSAGCSAAQQQQQQQPQQQAALPSATADEVFSIIARAVQQELRPVVSKLESQVESLDKTVRRHESRVESLDNRLTLLDSRMSTLTAHVLTNRLGERMEEVSSQLSGITARLDSQQSQLDSQQSQLDSQLSQLSELNTQLNEQNSQQEETAATVNNVTAQLDTVVTQQEDQLTETSKLVIRLDSQQSQLSELNAKLKQQKAQQGEIEATVNDNVDRLEYNVTLLENQLTKVSGLANRLDSQQSQLDELSDQLNEQKSLQNVTAVTTDDHLLTAPLDATTSQTVTLGSQLAETMNKTAASKESIDHLASEVKQPPTPRDCSGLPVGSPSGVYLLRPSGDSTQPPVQSYCDMDTAGGNWTVIQRRDDIEPRQDFYLGWKEYKEGFGDVTKEFWWGLEHLFQLTSSDRRYELRVDLEAFDGSRRHATYQGFRISSEEDGYQLSVSDYSGTAGNGLKFSVNEKFSTRDRDQDGRSDVHCAQRHQGPWWYGWRWLCGWSNLNGRYRDGSKWDRTGIWWWRWREAESLKKTDMKIRPT